jgi:hypothetical protein
LLASTRFWIFSLIHPDQVVVALEIDHLDALVDAPLQVVVLDEPLVGPGRDGEPARHRQTEARRDLTELGVLAAHAIGAIPAQLTERNAQLVVGNRPCAGEHRRQLGVDANETLAQGFVGGAAQGDHAVDHVAHAVANLGHRGPDVVAVEEELALGLLLQIAEQLENPIVGVEQ